MGANFSYKIHRRDVSASEIKEVFRTIREDAAWDRGHGGYTGTLAEKGGVSVVAGQTFPSLEAAVDYLDKHSDKYEDALACRFATGHKRTQREIAAEKKRQELEKELKELDGRVKGFDADILKRIKAGKSAQRSCGHCESKLSVKFLRLSDDAAVLRAAGMPARFSGELRCPVCGHSLLTPTDKKSLDGLEVKRKKKAAQLNDFSKNHPLKNEFEWVIGGWCSS